MATHGCTGIPCTICGAGSGDVDREVYVDPASKIIALLAEVEEERRQRRESDHIRASLSDALREVSSSMVRALDEIIELTKVLEAAQNWREHRQRPADAPEHALECALIDKVDAYLARIAERS